MRYITERQGLMEKKSRKGQKPTGVRAKAASPKARRDAATPESQSGLKEASLFMNGRSQAVRLPKEFRFEGTHVYAHKEGNRVILTPVDDRIERLIALMGSAPDFPDIPRDPPEPMRPEIREFFGVSDR
ncbi:MAG: type II toxin-antitoxin system VapB family antitoxin [Gemmatimonadaceae bacterium]|nr:type II toxin-antitoxin system VapB family antitoxin [Gemmatimonadaceae bacterium]